MLTTLDAVKAQLDIPNDDTTDDANLERMIKAVTDAIQTYCRRDFSKEYKMPGEEGDKPRLPYDIEDACILWIVYRHGLSGSIGLSSERIDGLGQKSYALQHIDGKTIPAPPAVLALIDPYREMIYR